MARRTYEFFAENGRQITSTVSGSGPPLILVHGLSGSRRWWRRNLSAFETHYTVYRLELIGFGYARRQRPVPLAHSAAIIARWMEHAHIERAHVLGHSMGGHICLHLAARFPERVDKLILAATTGLLRGQWWRMALQLPRVAVNGHLDFVPVVTTDALRAGLFNLYRAGRELLSDNTSELLSQVQAETLVISGGRDLLVPPSLGLELCSQLVHGEHVLLERAGHVVMWDAPAEFNEAVLRFLRQPSGDLP
ncbi:alpha/beta fold hydrolase [Deinococcus peraridilitoris]|uniref:Putative hydrolase or acyltransferase of alpha/beta superfamily n=1 Tax=Deinococcus peraridilitoris (strain DSM 19664 / LMG 22246 / CIP 109416 / KR-200) TaxID=937777 RepID=L0A5J4_DEIPD|nr:alpha/beta fold hydrolase [Deinococcus peraridilitoris]AFZ69111.1 putative hydrolase or acyltransferase of alpha/beta superfamily [Deinococcus peraridilitoris DSM 19664]